MSPEKLTKDELLDTLRGIIALIQADDSFEGNLTYSCLEEGLGRGEFAVTAAFRTGNSMGQGGMRLIGDPTT